MIVRNGFARGGWGGPAVPSLFSVLGHLHLSMAPVRAALAAVILLACLGVGAQEIVTFKDQRTEFILGHRVDGIWTYLQIPGGEVGVPTDQISGYREATDEEVKAGVVAKLRGEQESPVEPKADESGVTSPNTAQRSPKSLKSIAVQNSSGAKGPGKGPGKGPQKVKSPDNQSVTSTKKMG